MGGGSGVVREGWWSVAVCGSWLWAVAASGGNRIGFSRFSTTFKNLKKDKVKKLTKMFLWNKTKRVKWAFKKFNGLKDCMCYFFSK